MVSVQVEAEGDVATAFTLARILSNIPLSRGGPTSVVIFDIHALQVSPLHVFPSDRRECTAQPRKRAVWSTPPQV